MTALNYLAIQSAYCLFSIVIIIRITTSQAESGYQKRESIYSGFTGCYIVEVNYDYNQNAPNFLSLRDGVTPLALYKFQTENNLVDASMRLLNNIEHGWINSKPNCQVVILLYPSNEICMWKPQESFTWLLACKIPLKKSIPYVCYGKNTYFVAILHSSQAQLAQAPSPTPFYITRQNRWSYQRVARYFIVDRLKAFDLMLEVFYPCKSLVQIQIKRRDLGQERFRFLLDSLNRPLVVGACPILWVFYPWVESKATTFYTGNVSFHRKGAVDNNLVSSRRPTRNFMENITWISLQFLNGSYTEVYNARLKSRDLFSYIESYQVNTHTIPKVTGVAAFRGQSIDAYRFFKSRVTFNFISCDRGKAVLSFSAFSDPFELNLWLTLAGSSILLRLAMRRIFNDFKQNSFFFLLRLFLEQDLPIDLKLYKRLGFRVLYALLILVGVVLTNSYRGKVTGTMTTPMPKPQIRAIDEAVERGFKIIQKLPREVLHIHSTVSPSYMLTAGHKENVFRDAAKSNIFFESIDTTEESIVLPNETKRKYKWLYDGIRLNASYNYSMENDLLNCNRTIYVGELYQLKELFVEIRKSNHSNSRELYYGKDEYLSQNTIISIGKMSWDRLGLIYNQFQYVLQAGFLNTDWKNDLNQSRADYVEKLESTEFEVLTLDSNYVICALVLYALTASIAILNLIYEVATDWPSTRTRILENTQFLSVRVFSFTLPFRVWRRKKIKNSKNLNSTNALFFTVRSVHDQELLKVKN